jgi:hypothetical protein
VNGADAPLRRGLVPGRHRHSSVEDVEWREGWELIQRRNPEVNVRVQGRQSPKRADLYVVTGGRVVSIEFKYVGGGGLRDVQACAAQVRRHAAHHTEAILVLYSEGGRPLAPPVVQQLHRFTRAKNVRIIGIAGPEIPVASGAG